MSDKTTNLVSNWILLWTISENVPLTNRAEEHVLEQTRNWEFRSYNKYVFKIIGESYYKQNRLFT